MKQTLLEERVFFTPQRLSPLHRLFLVMATLISAPRSMALRRTSRVAHDINIHCGTIRRTPYMTPTDGGRKAAENGVQPGVSPSSHSELEPCNHMGLSGSDFNGLDRAFGFVGRGRGCAKPQEQSSVRNLAQYNDDHPSILCFGDGASVLVH
ncbi:hypothetical protein BJX96DRAFT_87399 [Aspergillus floccosus]